MQVVKLIIILVLIYILLDLISYLIFKRSNSATVVDFMLRLIKRRKKSAYRELEDHKNDREVDYEIPKIINFKCDINEIKLGKYKYYDLNSKGDKTVLYLHGGAFIHNPTVVHFEYLKALIEETNVRVIFPIYPLLPNHNYKDAYNFLTALYKLINNKDLIIMGDSAGGNLALGLIQRIKLKNKTIVFSPWVDLATNNKNIKKYEQKDSMLILESLKIYASVWKGDLKINEPILSPIYGDYSLYEDLHIFVGCNELLYPDIALFYDNCNKDKVKLYKGINQGHIYPLYPTKEAIKALKIVKEIINK